MDLWKPLLVILICSLYCRAYKFHLSEYPGIRVCRVREKECPTNPYPLYYLAYLKSIYGGCTHILGNLVICDLERYENGSDPDLSFLNAIKEVFGYVYFSRNSVRSISLPSLRVIRGEPPLNYDGINASFIATMNGKNRTHALEVINMPNLTAIKQHNVVLRYNPLLCHLAFTVRWEEVFLDKNVQGTTPDRHNDVISQTGCDPTFREPVKKRIREKCHSRCATQYPDGFCWGPGPESCQKLVKCADDKGRYCQDGPSTMIPCNQECLGGCDQHPNNCRACMSARDGNKCVSQCPPKEIVNRVDSRLQPNPNFKYTFHDICVKDCPAPFLKSNIYCVIECNLKSQIPVNGTCQQCPASGCPEHCTEDQIFEVQPHILDARALDRLKSCTYYTGSIYISSESFSTSSTPLGNLLQPIQDISKLWNLRSIKGMVGYIYMDLRGAPPELKNLTFLDNLEMLVWESGKIQIPMITILNGEHIEMLGFRSLNNIQSTVVLINMTKLCYTSALTKAIPVRMRNVPTEQECVQRGAVCHSECLPEAGCWGPTADMCAHCCNQKAGNFCVSECTDRPGYYELRRTRSSIVTHEPGKGTCPTLPAITMLGDHTDEDRLRMARLPAQECSRCHEECAHTCYGPGSHECQGGCKHFQFNDTCVPVCPPATYKETGTNQCLPCHPTCMRTTLSARARLCSGPGDHFGLGGCTACLTVLKNNITQQFQCLTHDCPLKHYIESYSPMQFIQKEKLTVSVETQELAESKLSAGFMLRLCKPCHPYCDVCTANGTHSSICHSCSHWWFKSECVLKCPPAETYSPKRLNTTTINPITSPIPSAVTAAVSANQSDTVTLGPGIQRQLRNSAKIDEDQRRNRTVNIYKLAPGQRHCLLCHEECVQGCSGPGPTDCVKCRNYMIVLDEIEETFICNSSCPDEKPHVLHGVCLNAEQYDTLSGQSARELRDHILIGVSVAVLLIVILATLALVLSLKRKAKAERMREKLRAAYTNLIEPDKDELMKNQSTIREPNMGRLEMINADDLEYDPDATPLGSGAFGVVHRGRWHVPKAALLRHGCRGEAKLDVAIKVIQNDCPISPGVLEKPSPFANANGTRDEEEEAKRATARANLEELLQEAKVMASVEHRHCLPLIGVCLSRERHCLVSVFVELGSLDKYVQEHQADLNSLIMLSWAEQIADGMSYLEMRGIIHRDLAARNVLVQRRDLVQITDFGLAKMLERKDEDSVIVRAGRVPVRWLAIETLQDSVYSHKTDVWTYGVTLWEIFTYGRRPYEDVETKNIKDHVMKGGRLTQPEICTLDVYMVMVKCWMEDYESRPTFAELKRTFHNFCKTPGRYLYIQGDEYAINYHTSTYSASANISADTHELQPLLNRGLPDGSAYTAKTNGSLCRTTFSDVSAGTLPFNSPNRFVRPSNPMDYPHSPIGTRFEHLQSAEPNAIDDADALLPTRANPTGHSMWTMRGRTPVTTNATAPSQSAMVCNPANENKSRVATRQGLSGSIPSGNASPRHPGHVAAPLASREDSWIAETPDSPSWRPPINPDERAIVQRSPRKRFFRNTEGPSTGDSFPSGRAIQPGNPATTWGQTDNHSGYLLPPSNSTPVNMQEDGYLEPKSASFTPTPRINQGPLGTTKPTPNTIMEDDYLTPKSNCPAGDEPPVTDFGITNMEYFMQPYLSPSGPEYSDTRRTDADGSDDKL